MQDYNLLRRLLGYGALTSSFIPIFMEELSLRIKEEARELVTKVSSLITLILVTLPIIGILF